MTGDVGAGGILYDKLRARFIARFGCNNAQGLCIYVT